MANGQNLQAILDLAKNVGANLAADSKVPMTTADQPNVTKAVIDAVRETPIAQNALNLEGLGNSRIMVGGLFALGMQVLRPFGVAVAPEDVGQWIDAGTALLTIAGIVYGLVGRVKGAKWAPIKWPWSA